MVRTLLISSLFFMFLNGTGQTGFNDKLSTAALELTKQKVQYDPAYFKIKYPEGDVPANKGVCTDVIIRAYRKLGIDLQKEVHIDLPQEKKPLQIVMAFLMQNFEKVL